MVYLLLPDGGKVAFEASVERLEISPTTHLTQSSFSYQLVAIIDPYGQATTFTSGPNSVTIEEPAHRTLTLYYITTPWNGDVVIDRVVASDGRSVKYNYGSYQPAENTQYTFLGNVQYRDTESAIYATAIYSYQPNNADPDGRPLIHWAIDPMYSGPMFAIAYEFVPGSSGGFYGQIQSENYLDPRSGAVGPAVSSLSINGSVRTETRGDGPSRTFTYNGARIGSYTDFKGQPSYISYDGYGFVWAFTDARGNVTTTSREGSVGAISVLTHPDAEHSTQGYTYWQSNGGNYYVQIRGDERGHNTYFNRDANFRVTRIDYPDYPNPCAYETFSYNGFGQVETHTKSSGGPGSSTETRHYDGRGMMFQSDNPDGNTYYEYDGLDRLTRVTDSLGHTTSYLYNARGQTTRVTHHDGTYTQFGYNYEGTLAWSADENHPGAESDPNQRTRYVYDDYKRVVSVTNPLNQTTTFAYSPTNIGWYENPYLHTSNALSDARSPMGRITSFTADANFRRIALWDADYTDEMTYSTYDYDAVGNLTRIQDPKNNVTSFGYDARNRKTSVTNALNETTSWQYDTTGNLTRETRPDQSYRRAEYDSMNRVIDSYGFAGEHTHYDRDLAGNVHQLVDAKGASYVFYYDALNRMASAWYPPDASNVTRYDAWYRDPAGNVYRHDNPAGNVQVFDYDNRNRMYHSYWWGNVGPEITIGFDAANRMVSAVTNSGETSLSFGYDNANRRISEELTVQGQPTRRIEMGWNADGLRESLSLPAMPGVGMSYTYNQRRQLDRINDLYGNHWFKYDYDLAGNMIQRQNVWASINDATRAEYDALNRPTVWENSWVGDAVFARSRYQYDNVSREAATWRDEQSSKGEKFWYTDSDQLAVVEYNADNVWSGNPTYGSWDRWVGYGYTPDLLNRQSVNDNGTVTGFTPDGLNQYTTVGGQGLSYDPNFNLSSYNGASFAYNAQNQFMSGNGAGGSVQNVYDALGRCVKRTVNGVDTFVVYDGWKPFLEFDVAGNNTGSFAYGPGADEILWRWSASAGEVYYHTDRHGNVTFLLDGGGAPAEKYRYDAFGHPTITDWDGNGRAQSAFDNRFMFQGREWLPQLGIYDFRNRMYQPELGRFMQKDPLGFDAGDANLFRYCGGDPVNRSDPFGLKDETKKKDGSDGSGETAEEKARGDWNYGLGGGSGNAPFSTFGFWSNPDGTPTGVGDRGPASRSRLGDGGRGGGSGGADTDDVGGYITVLGNSNLSRGLLTFNTLSVGFSGAVPWAFIGDYFGFQLGDARLSRAGAAARGWLAYYHPELHPTELHITEGSPLYSFPGFLFGARDLGQHDTYTGAIEVDPTLNVTMPQYINTMSHELMHDLYGYWHSHNDIRFLARSIENEYYIHH